MYKAKVIADNDFPVRFRDKPSTITGQIISSLKKGTIVEVLEEVDCDWSMIQYEGTTGYMMTKFLKQVADSEVNVTKDELRQIYNELKNMLQRINTILQ